MQEQLITISADVLGGTPVFYNTRVPVKNLFDYIKGGDSLDDFLTDFPSVKKDQALKILSHAENIITVTASLNETAA